MRRAPISWRSAKKWAGRPARSTCSGVRQRAGNASGDAPAVACCVSVWRRGSAPPYRSVSVAVRSPAVGKRDDATMTPGIGHGSGWSWSDLFCIGRRREVRPFARHVGRLWCDKTRRLAIHLCTIGRCRIGRSRLDVSRRPVSGTRHDDSGRSVGRPRHYRSRSIRSRVDVEACGLHVDSSGCHIDRLCFGCGNLRRRQSRNRESQ
jgi:hypothetical protein